MYLLRLPGSRSVALLSSALIRILSFVFLRWIPGHPFPPLILATAAVYIFSLYWFLSGYAPADDPFASPINKASVRSERKFGSEVVERPRRTAVLRSKQQNGSAPEKPARNEDLDEERARDVSKTQTPSAAAVLLSGIPRMGTIFWNNVTVLGNLALVLMVVDLTFRAPLLYPSHELAFARVGYVDERSAKILVREPDPQQLPLFVSYRPEAERSWTQADAIYATSEERDYTYVVHVQKLQHSTSYLYSVSNGRSGSFRTAPPVGKLDKATSKFTFLTTSCIKPRFPYSPLQHPLYIPGLEHVAGIASRLRASFMLFLGDFIYVDVPFRAGSKPQTYRAEYRRAYASPSWEAAGRHLPWLHVMDDHEIANDWDRGLQQPYPAALDPFAIYHHSLNPPARDENETYYAFKQGPASFFLADTRRYRSPASGLPDAHPSKTMLGARQLGAALEWLRDPEPAGVQWKIFVSSVPFTRNWRVNARDTWGGYLAERQALLEAMWDAASGERRYGAVVLSGDRHEFAATKFPAPAAGTEEESEQARLARTFGPGAGEARWAAGAAAYEFSCSPLSMFYLPVRTYRERAGEQSGAGAGGEDQALAYVPDGNSKIGAVEVEQAVGSAQSSLRYRLFVDGQESWSYVLTSGEERRAGAAGRRAIWE